jgi:hypothetical protein
LGNIAGNSQYLASKSARGGENSLKDGIERSGSKKRDGSLNNNKEVNG